MGSAKWRVGDWAVYLKQKSSLSPGPRAKEVTPASAGDTYSYIVEKYWVVEALLPDNQLRLKTRRGKRHVVSVEDPALRKPRWWEKIFSASRFPSANPERASSV
jgi:hypothetical protein